VELYDSVLIRRWHGRTDRHKGAIDSAREEFLFLSVNEMVAEFSEDQSTDSSSESVGTGACRSERVVPGVLTLACLSRGARSADEITAAMLAQMLERKGFATLSFTMAGASPMTGSH